jgi:putative oxygen-independent coproporphyrinogen III oxidase
MRPTHQAGSVRSAAQPLSPGPGGPTLACLRHDTAAPTTDAGLYVHIPFCLSRCGYCDFNTYAGLDRLSERYVHAVKSESELRAGAWEGVRFRSLFLGGGTPTTLSTPTIRRLLAHLRGAFVIEPRAEVTAEANPDTIDPPYLTALRGAGVTRLSIGVQSLDPSVLEALERLHSADSAIQAYRAARRAGFDEVNLDLIYGASGETLTSWRRTLARAVDLGPDHLSCYALTIEPATSLGRKVAAGVVPAPDPDLQAEMYGAACEMLGRAGYEHYEISNWARSGHRSVHNMGYWEGRAYLGLGAGAHSFRDGMRSWNVRPPLQYLKEVERGRPPTGGSERLTDGERAMERLLLGLRVSDGVAAHWVDPDRVAAYVADGLAHRKDGRVILTDRGMLLANEIILGLTP